MFEQPQHQSELQEPAVWWWVWNYHCQKGETKVLHYRFKEKNMTLVQNNEPFYNQIPSLCPLAHSILEFHARGQFRCVLTHKIRFSAVPRWLLNMTPLLGVAGDSSLVSTNLKLPTDYLWRICLTPSPHSTKHSLCSSDTDYTYLLSKLRQTSFSWLTLPFLLLGLRAQKTW